MRNDIIWGHFRLFCFTLTHLPSSFISPRLNVCPIDVNNLFICIWYSHRVATTFFHPSLLYIVTFKLSAAGHSIAPSLSVISYLDPHIINFFLCFIRCAFNISTYGLCVLKFVWKFKSFENNVKFKRKSKKF